MRLPVVSDIVIKACRHTLCRSFYDCLRKICLFRQTQAEDRRRRRNSARLIFAQTCVASYPD